MNKGNGNRWLEFLPIIDGNLVIEGDEWNTGNLPAEFPNELWIRVMSDGEMLSGFYSADGTNWESIGRPLSVEGIEDPGVGVYALRGAASRPVVTAEFDRFNLLPTDDEFDGEAIDRCRWEIQNEDATGYSLGDGQLTIRTLRGELSNNFSTVKNVFVQPTGDSDWQATTRITLTPTHSGQQGGLVVRGENASNHSKIVLVRKENGQRWIEFLRTTDGATDFNGTWNTGYIDFPASVYVRLVSDGEQLSGYWSEDGEEWTKVGDSRSIDGIESPKVGPMALSGENDNPPIDVDFDFFHLDPNMTVEPAPDCLTQSEPETGFAKIFDGTQASFDNWEHAGPGYFTFNAAEQSMVSGNDPADPSYGLHWYPDAQYGNFRMRMQFKLSDDTDNSGVFVRFPNPGDDPNIPVNQGHEIQINENPGGDPQKTASIYNTDREDFRNARPPGEWNDYEISVVGQRYTICLNGKIVNDHVSTAGRAALGLRRPAEPRPGVQRRLPRRPRAGAARDVGDLQHDRHHDARDAQQRRHPRHAAALLVHRGVAAAVEVGRRAGRRHVRRGAAADARHVRHGPEPRLVQRPDDHAAGGTAQPVRQAALLRLHDGRRGRPGGRRRHGDVRRRDDGDDDRPLPRLGADRR